ncbi:MAG: hypothetical protein ACTSQJ_03075 [Promethearchaeota archaeon]
MERKIIEKIETYMSIDIYDNGYAEETPFTMILDISNVKPGEIELEDERKMSYLWRKYSKSSEK